MVNDKIPPNHIEIEANILGCLLTSPEVAPVIISDVTAEMFYKNEHQIIYGVIEKLDRLDQPINIISVMAELKAIDSLDIIGGPLVLTNLSRSANPIDKINYYTSILKSDYIRREIIKTSTISSRKAYDLSIPSGEILDEVENSVMTISGNNASELSSMTTNVDDALKHVQMRMANKNYGVMSGLTELDRNTNGFESPDLIIIAARPAMGKSALAATIARNLSDTYYVAMFSLEMSKLQITIRYLSGDTGIPHEKIRTGDLNDEEFDFLNNNVNSLINSKLFIDDTPSLSLSSLRSKCRMLKRKYDLQAVVIDYLQLMTLEKSFKGSREEKIATISQGLKALAKELDIPVIALSQLSRSVETRGGSKRPQLSDLRESGAIEQDADMVCFLYRPSYYGIDEKEDGTTVDPGDTELICAKYRSGSLFTADLFFNMDTVTFINTNTWKD